MIFLCWLGELTTHRSHTATGLKKIKTCLRERCVSQHLLQSMVLKCFTWDQDDEQRNYILKSEDIFFYSQLFQFNMIITNSAALRNISTIFQNNIIQSLSCIKTFFNWSEQVKSFTKMGIFLYHFCVDGFSSLAALPQITIQWLFEKWFFCVDFVYLFRIYQKWVHQILKDFFYIYSVESHK